MCRPLVTTSSSRMSIFRRDVIVPVTKENYGPVYVHHTPSLIAGHRIKFHRLVRTRCNDHDRLGFSADICVLTDIR